MIADKKAEMEHCRQQAIAELHKIDVCSLQEFISFHHPPPAVLSILQYVLIILAGNYSEIALNPATNEPAKVNWQACRKMACCNSKTFLQACTEIFDKFDNDSYLDARVEAAAKQVKNEGITSEKAKATSLACARLLLWVQNVIRYWQARKGE